MTSIQAILLLQVHVERRQIPCHLTHTTAATHAMIEANLHETPKYGGWVDSKGPRYCPSIEDKVVRFKDKDSHQVQLHSLQTCFGILNIVLFMLSRLCHGCLVDSPHNASEVAWELKALSMPELFMLQLRLACCKPNLL